MFVRCSWHTTFNQAFVKFVLEFSKTFYKQNMPWLEYDCTQTVLKL